MEDTMKNSLLLMRVGKKLPWLAIALLCLAQTPVYSGDLTTDNITVKNDETIYGKLIVKASGSAPTNGLIFYYSLNTNSVPVPDDSGNGNTGTVTGATWTTNGITGGAYSFDGTDDYITVANESYFDTPLDGFHPCSISFWFKTPASNPSSRETIFTKGNDPNFFGIYLADNDHNIWFDLKHNGDLSGAFPATFDNCWHYAVLTYDGSNTGAGMKYWQDGVSVAGSASGALGSAIANNVAVTLGSGVVGGWNYGGGLDEIRIYNRVLTASEIIGLFYNGIPPTNNSARFESGVNYIYPLGDIGMGVFTNQP
jgi:hypothetical protein